MMGSDHEWSYVRINGKNYHIDPTFVLGTDGSLAYFMMTDRQREVWGYGRDEYVITSNYSHEVPLPDYVADDGTFTPIWDWCFGELLTEEDRLRCWQYTEGWEKRYFDFGYAGY